MSAATREITLKSSRVTDFELQVLEEVAHKVSDPLQKVLLSVVDMLRDGKDVLIFVHGSESPTKSDEEGEK